MKRHLLVAISLLLCATTAVMAAISFWHTSTISWQRSERTTWFLSFHRGRVELARQSVGAISTYWGVHAEITTVTGVDVSALGRLRISGLARIVGGPPPLHDSSPSTSPEMTMANMESGIDPHRIDRGRWGFGYGKQEFFDLWTAPVWVFILLFLTPGIIQFARKYPQWRRRREGLCMKCGYDLRETPDRCPECGNVPEKSPA